MWSFHLEQGSLVVNANGAHVVEQDLDKTKLAYAKELRHLTHDKACDVFQVRGVDSDHWPEWWEMSTG